MTIEDLPEFGGLRVASWHVTDDEIHVVAKPVSDCGDCPGCGQRSDHLHSHYQRHVRDLPLCQHRLVLDLEVRRFRCTNPRCDRKVFCERLEALVAVYQRRSLRLIEVMRWLSLRVSAEDGGRILRQVGVDSSPDTLLREARKSVIGTQTRLTVRVVGIDDFAFRRGQTYGTVVVNLETHAPITLLPDREVGTVRDWLAQHPEIVAVARDRFNGYGEASTQGAPQASQIADRWHLLKNLSETLERRIAQAYGQLKRWWAEAHSATLDPPSASVAKPAATVVKPLLSPGRQKRLERIQAVKSLKQLGMNNSQIARKLGLSRQS